MEYLSHDDLERKFAELGMEERLRNCKQVRAYHDPDLRTHPPLTSVKHKREYGIEWKPDGNGNSALIYHWEAPDGKPKRSIRFFTCDGVRYRIRYPSMESISVPGSDSAAGIISG